MELDIGAVESGRKISALIDLEKVTNENFISTVVEKISKGLDRAEELLRINADKLADAANSVVQYELPTQSGEPMLMDVRYDGEGNNVQNVAFLLKDNKPDGNYTYRLPTKENHNLIVTYTFKNGGIRNVSLDTDFRPQNLTKSDPDVFTVLSNKGYEIVFVFYWNKEGGISNVHVFPMVNPFLPHELEAI